MHHANLLDVAMKVLQRSEAGAWVGEYFGFNDMFTATASEHLTLSTLTQHFTLSFILIKRVKGHVPVCVRPRKGKSSNCITKYCFIDFASEQDFER